MKKKNWIIIFILLMTLFISLTNINVRADDENTEEDNIEEVTDEEDEVTVDWKTLGIYSAVAIAGFGFAMIVYIINKAKPNKKKEENKKEIQ